MNNLQNICNSLNIQDIESMEMLNKKIDNISVAVWLKYTDDQFAEKIRYLSIHEKNILIEYCKILLHEKYVSY